MLNTTSTCLHSAAIYPIHLHRSPYWYDDPRHDPEKQSLRIEGAVWSASQGKDAVGGMYGLPPEKVMQEGYFQGGRYCDWGFRKTQEITPLLAKRVGRPVRMTLTRSQMYEFNMNQRFFAPEDRL